MNPGKVSAVCGKATRQFVRVMRCESVKVLGMWWWNEGLAVCSSVCVVVEVEE